MDTNTLELAECIDTICDQCGEPYEGFCKVYTDEDGQPIGHVECVDEEIAQRQIDRYLNSRD